MALSLKKCGDKAEWDNFISSSPQGSVFCETFFLDALAISYDLYFVEDNGSPCMAVPILLKNSLEPHRHPYAFSLYQGPVFSELIEALLPHSRISEKMRILDYLLIELEQRFARISFSLHHEHEDLRSFLWFHHHEPSLGQFHSRLFYTGLIQRVEFEKYIASIRKSRRTEWRKAQRDGLKIVESDDISALIELYKMTFERQDISVDQSTIELAERIARAAIATRKGNLQFCSNVDGKPISANLFLFDKKSAYYLIGANHPEYRNSGAGTFLLLENIRKSFELGCEAVDVCGINSPSRGDFKISFNAQPKPYYVVDWVKP